MATDDVWQLQLLQTYNSQLIQNSLTFRTKAATTVTQALAQSLADDWKDAFKAQQVGGVFYRGWVLQQLRGGTVTYPTGLCRREGGARYDGIVSMPNYGAITGSGCPPQAAAVFTLKTGLAGRRRRGRFYFTAWDRANQLEGKLVAGFNTALQALWTAQLVKFGVGGSSALWQLGIWSMRIATGCEPAAAHPHEMTNVDAPDPAAAYMDVTSVQVRDIVYSQRRRTIGVGR